MKLLNRQLRSLLGSIEESTDHAFERLILTSLLVFTLMTMMFSMSVSVTVLLVNVALGVTASVLKEILH